MVEMIVDEDVCRLIAAKEGLSLDFIVKEFYLMDLLRQLSAIGALEGLIFKGGTALNKVFLKENYRFSEDLDFDFAGKSWPETFGSITKRINGFKGPETRRIIRNKVVQMDFLYVTSWGKKDRVRLDINVKPYIKSVTPPKGAEVTSTFAGFSVDSVPTYGLEDLLARKMSALKDRTEGKDVFDANNALNLVQDAKLLRAISIVGKETGTSAIDFIEETMQRLENADYKRMRNFTNPYIPIKNRPPDWKILTDTLSGKLRLLLSKAERRSRKR